MAKPEGAATKKEPRVSRNKSLVLGVGQCNRSQMYHKWELWTIKAKNSGSLPIHSKPKAIDTFYSLTSVINPNFNPVDDVPKHLVNKCIIKPTKLRSNITPRTMLILLARQFQGKRVMFFKYLDSRLLLVTCPFEINGVPIRRVNQAYEIATSTKLDINRVNVSKLMHTSRDR